jgi:branched-subunit amino acid aminotransferase/4-amino-4-deoxychorismate lyase
MEVWLDGSFLARDDARISAFDAGIQHAVGLFETMHVRRGAVLRLEAHLERLHRSATELKLTETLRVEPLAEAVQRTVERNGLRDGRVRLTITGGDLNMLQQRGARSSHAPTMLIVAQPPTAYPRELFERGVRVVVADGRVNPLDRFASHKTLWYWPRLAALQAAGAAGASEALWFSVTNHLACGCVSNVFVRSGDRLLTPYARGEEASGALPAPVLPGITRSIVLELVERGLGERTGLPGLRIERRMLTIDDVLGADEVFLTNCSWGVLPVVGVEQSTIGDGAPGRLATSLLEAWRGL